MSKILKFYIPLIDNVAVQMPKGAIIRHVGQQDSYPSTIMLWAELDPGADREARTFNVYGTGHPMPAAPGIYRGTVHFSHGMVFHLYETTPDQVDDGIKDWNE